MFVKHLLFYCTVFCAIVIFCNFVFDFFEKMKIKAPVLCFKCMEKKKISSVDSRMRV